MPNSYDAEMNLRLWALRYADAHHALMKHMSKESDPQLDAKLSQASLDAVQGLIVAAREFCKVSP